ncbi:hypothetical protein I7I53_08037 [Histoplasma capsulatum var. duboisii H88]|uniref:Uncharacterized protein n=1 Tax=Ajellomyces capsulatus (strain H88) TaxID=544711 RepID=A0A8A1LKA4_AJEC8|nr:hypothetical protein I7I53_08037 [Histoplasma capsulatum var. duboisii H88]
MRWLGLHVGQLFSSITKISEKVWYKKTKERKGKGKERENPKKKKKKKKKKRSEWASIGRGECSLAATKVLGAKCTPFSDNS